MDSCGEALMEENKRLQIENNNIPILQEQIEELKKQLTVASGGSRTSVSEIKRVKDLEVGLCLRLSCFGELLRWRTVAVDLTKSCVARTL